MAYSDQLAKLTFSLESFNKNIEKLKKEEQSEVVKVLKAGAAAYANAAAKHTPPDPGKAKLDPLWYADGVRYDRSSNARAKGRRRVYDLLTLARDPSTGHYRSHYGKLLRQGFYFVVSIKRPGRPIKQIPCRTEAEAARYAHETYRGLARYGWGMALQSVTGKAPAGAFSTLRSQRPRLGNVFAGRGTLQGETITLINDRLKASESYMSSLETNAQIAAVKTMDSRMEKFFKKKRDL